MGREKDEKAPRTTRLAYCSEDIVVKSDLVNGSLAERVAECYLYVFPIYIPVCKYLIIVCTYKVRSFFRCSGGRKGPAQVDSCIPLPQSGASGSGFWFTIYKMYGSNLLFLKHSLIVSVFGLLDCCKANQTNDVISSVEWIYARTASTIVTHPAPPSRLVLGRYRPIFGPVVMLDCLGKMPVQARVLHSSPVMYRLL